MLRTDFLKSLGMIILTPILSKFHKVNTDVFLTEFFVAGYQYYDGDTVIKSLRENEELVLKREPSNPYDFYAIEIYTRNNVKLGYVPARLNKMLARMLDQDVNLKIKVKEKDPEAVDWEKLRVRIYLVKESENSLSFN